MQNRINLILQTKNISAKQFAEEIGIQPSGMSHILSGRNNPSLDFIKRVITKYPEISMDWLVFGTGQMLKHFQPSEVVSTTVEHTPETTPPPCQEPILEQEYSFEYAPETPDLFSQPIEEHAEYLAPNAESASEEAKDEPAPPAPLSENIFTKPASGKAIKKIVVFYTDNTYKELHVTEE